jgi:hypothetical protein
MRGYRLEAVSDHDETALSRSQTRLLPRTSFDSRRVPPAKNSHCHQLACGSYRSRISNRRWLVHTRPRTICMRAAAPVAAPSRIVRLYLTDFELEIGQVKAVGQTPPFRTLRWVCCPQCKRPALGNAAKPGALQIQDETGTTCGSTGPLVRARFRARDQSCAAYATSISASPDGLLSASR